jgi:hypothetical protein
MILRLMVALLALWILSLLALAASSLLTLA